MPVVIVVAAAAKKDLTGLRTFLAAKDSPESSRRVLARIRDVIKSLKELPEGGHFPPEMTLLGVHAYREVHSGPYRIIYEIRDRNVYVHAVLDARRDLGDLLLARLVR